jgi:hypothetical protein
MMTSMPESTAALIGPDSTSESASVVMMPLGPEGRGLLDDAGHVGEVAGRRIAVLDFNAHLLAGKRDAVLDGVPPAVAVGCVADEHVALAFG